MATDWVWISPLVLSSESFRLFAALRNRCVRFVWIRSAKQFCCLSMVLYGKLTSPRRQAGFGCSLGRTKEALA